MTRQVSAFCLFGIFLIVSIIVKHTYAVSSSVIEPESLLGGKIEISIPADFKPMSEEKRNIKWHSKNKRPFMVYTNQAGITYIAFFLWNVQSSSENIAQLKDKAVQDIKQLNSPMRWYADETKDINGQKTGIIEYSIPNTNGVYKTYNLVFLTPFEGKLLDASFHSTFIDEIDPVQRGLAYEVLSSIKFRNATNSSASFRINLKNGVYFSIGGFLLFLGGFRTLRARRRWTDVPISKIRSLAVGPVRIQGRLVSFSRKVQVSLLSQKPYAFSSISIEDLQWNFAIKDWRLLNHTGYWGNDLYLEDDTGRVKIDPAEFILFSQRSYQFTMLPFRKIPSSVERLLHQYQISNRPSILGFRLPITRILRVKEYVLNQGEKVQIVGFAKLLNQNIKTTAQAEKLVVTNNGDTNFVMISSKESIPKNKRLLFLIFGGSLLMSLGLGLIARSYSLIRSEAVFLLFVFFGTSLAILYSVGYHRRWGK